MSHLCSKLVAGVAIAALSTCTLASPTYTSIGDFDILGTSYSVSLLSDTSLQTQTFNALSPSITFTTEADATEAVNVLLNALGASYDWNPTCIDCTDGFRVVFGFTDTTYSYMTGYYLGGPNGPFTVSRDGANNFSFAQFTPNNSVPEPGTLALLSISLAGITAKRRKQQ